MASASAKMPQRRAFYGFLGLWARPCPYFLTTRDRRARTRVTVAHDSMFACLSRVVPARPRRPAMMHLVSVQSDVFP